MVRLSKPMRSIDAFAGIGGFALALQGFASPTVYVEWEKEAQDILLQRQAEGLLEDAIICGDIRGCTPATLRLTKVDLITAGFPCQDISNMGHKAGLKGQRSGLFLQICRLAADLQPAFLFFENVSALVKLGLTTVLKELHELGYDVSWTVISAGNLGAAHLRKRLYILACRRPGAGESAATSSRKRDRRFLADEDKFSVASPSGTSTSKKMRATRNGKRLHEKALSFWSSKSRIARLSYKGAGEDDRKGWKRRCGALGNSIVPTCARAAFMHLVLRDGVALPDPAGTSMEQADEVQKWMASSETAIQKAGDQGLHHVWRKSAAAASRAAKKEDQRALGGLPPNAGVMIDGVITELDSLHAVLPQFEDGSLCLPQGGVTLVGNGMKSRNAKQTTPLLDECCLKRLATPRHGGWGVSHVLTKRSKDDLQTQMCFAADQKDSGSEKLLRTSHPNPQYVEMMMGYPQGWTRP